MGPLLIFLLLVTVSATSGQKRSKEVCPVTTCETSVAYTVLNSSSNAGSEFNNTAKNASNVRMTSGGLWCPETEDIDEFVTVDLGCVQPVCGVLGHHPLLLQYAMDHSKDNVLWHNAVTFSSCDNSFDQIFLLFEGGTRRKIIGPPVRARYLKFYNVIYKSKEHNKEFKERFHPCLKLELYIGPNDAVESVGCLNDTKIRGFPPALRRVYHNVQGVDKKNPDVLAIYEECRLKAEQSSKPIEVFGVRNYKFCVTTRSGKRKQFSKYRKSSKCFVCRGKGIGAGKGQIFVYKRKI